MKMRTKIKRALTTNIGLKLLALLFALGLWVVVVNVDDPTQTRTFAAPVSVINEEVLTEAGRYYTIPDGNTVRFRVTARRSVIERLKSTDFTATADMNFLENDNRIPVTVVLNSSYSNVTISASKLYLYVQVGEDMMVKKEVSVEPQGTLAEGCVVQTTSVNPSSVSMTGPEEVLQQVVKVVAYVDVENASSDITAENVVLHFLDDAGNEVDRSRIKVDQDTATVTVTIVREKQVDVIVGTSGQLPEGLYLDSVTVNPEKVYIVGSADALNNITAIEIPDKIVDLSKIQGSTTTTVDLNEYLPEGVKVVDGASAEAKIVIKVSEDATKKFEVPTANITVRNLGDDVTASFKDSKVTVRITGNKEELAALDAKTITGFVDASGLSEGEHTLQLNLELGDTYKYEPVTVEIVINQKE